MNVTYEWLYDHYAAPQMRGEGQEALAGRIAAAARAGDGLDFGDLLDQLRLRWGAEAFALGLQLGLHLMAAAPPPQDFFDSLGTARGGPAGGRPAP